MEFADSNPHQTKRWVTDGSGHFSHLMVFAFYEFDCDPAVRNRFANSDRRGSGGEIRLRIENPAPTGECAMSADYEAVLQALE